MLNRLNQMLQEATKLTSELEIQQISNALIRIMLQHACISLAEISIQTRNLQAQNPTNTPPLPLEQLRIPSDGTLVSCLGELLLAAENDGWNGISRILWQEIPVRPCTRIIKSGDFTIENLLQNYVAVRNDRVHGIPGNFITEAELDLVKVLIEKLSPILPYIVDDALIINRPDNKPYQLKLLKVYDGDLICYRKIQKRPSAKCIVQAQRQKSLRELEEVTYETEDILGTQSTNEQPQYNIRATSVENWSPLVMVPDRLTEDFTGRDKELEQILEWADDLESRACMLYGDGGIGKTTLAIEFIHRLFEGVLKSNWKPELITFYTAKQTRWGLNGLEVIRAREVGVSDTAVAIVRAFDSSPLSRDWFNKEPEAIIQKLASYLKELGIDRNSHLLILDNTETMAKSEEDVKALALQIQELSRRVGRVLLTSRRRESIEARPIEIRRLNDDDAIIFLRKRGEALNRKSIIQAGNSTLKQFANKLGNKPLVLEVFIQALGEQGISLKQALDRVVQMQRQDLGEFLYTDAWGRMSNHMRHLLLLMTQVSDIHDEFLLKLCCMQADITVIEANDAIEESRGIASTSRINGHSQITFSPEFLTYCEQRTIIIDGTSHPTQTSIDLIKRRYNEFLRSSTAKVSDRVGLAYRHALARAAWLAFHEYRFDDCEFYYEEACVADPQNGWLYDRYAYFLFSQGRLNDALDKSMHATKLIGNDPEAWFTRGLVEARLGKTQDAITSLNKARHYKKPEHLCLLQMAYAYLNDTPPDKAKARISLEESEKKNPNDQYHWKHIQEIGKVQYKYDL